MYIYIQVYMMKYTVMLFVPSFISRFLLHVVEIFLDLHYCMLSVRA